MKRYGDLMICSHCGKVLNSDRRMFCVHCGYPLKGEKKGFFAKSEETGISRAEELAAENAMPEMPALDIPPHSAAAAAMQNAQQIPPKNTVAPMGIAQPMGTPMGIQQPMQGMPGGMTPMTAQAVVPGMPGGINGTPQMGYGMPQIPYGMPQMQYGMPQFSGYDASGNPVYMQMLPQLVGYDAYGNPVYNMVAVPYMMPAVQGMPGMSPMIQPQAVYPQEQIIDVPQEQIRPADVSPAAQQTPAVQAAPGMQTMQSAPAPQTKMAAVPNIQPVPMQAAKPAAIQSPAPAMQPIQSVQAAAQAVQEALSTLQGVNIIQSAEPVPPAPYQSVQISSTDDMPMDAESLIGEDENAPDEKALLDSIFSSKSKNYSMSNGIKHAAATFSINVSANEITSVRDDAFGSLSEAAPPPVQSLFSKPGVHSVSEAPVTMPEPAPTPVSASAPKSAAKKASKPRTEEAANAAKRAAKAQKLKEKEAKEPKPSKKKAQKKPPARIVSPDEFFEDKPHNGTRSTSTLSVKELDQMDDEQLAAHLSSMGANTGGKKSNRSMKAASNEEMDVSNIDVDALLAAANSRLPN